MNELNKFILEQLEVDLEYLRNIKAKNRYISNKRHLLVGLLRDAFKWAVPYIAEHMQRTVNGINVSITKHRHLMEVDAEYKLEYLRLLDASKKYDIERYNYQYKNNFRPVRLKHPKTGEELYFKSRTACAKHFKCSSSLINYYMNNKIRLFFGYEVI